MQIKLLVSFKWFWEYLIGYHSNVFPLCSPFCASTESTLFSLLLILLQKSIEDKLANMKKEKRVIKEEIDRINPELRKVNFQS